MIHGDDVILLADNDTISKFISIFGSRYEIKVRAALGLDAGDDTEVIALNRLFKLVGLGGDDFQLEYEADPRHVEVVLKELKLDDAKGVCSPGTNDEGTTAPDRDDLLEVGRAKGYLP